MYNSPYQQWTLQSKQVYLFLSPIEIFKPTYVSMFQLIQIKVLAAVCLRSLNDTAVK